MNLWGTFHLFIINPCRASDLLEYLFVLIKDTEGGDGVGPVARGRGGGGPKLWGLRFEIRWLQVEHGRDLGDEQKRGGCLDPCWGWKVPSQPRLEQQHKVKLCLCPREDQAH